MARAWWHANRSVLRTRKRLRAGFRGALKQATAKRFAELEKEHAEKLRDLRVREAEMDSEHARLLSTLYSLGGAQVRDFQLSKTLTVSVTIQHELMLRAKDVNTLVYHVADQMGKRVERAVIDLFAGK